MTSKSSALDGQLLRILAMRMRVQRAPLIAKHQIAGVKHFLENIPSRLFGFKSAWYFDDRDF